MIFGYLRIEPDTPECQDLVSLLEGEGCTRVFQDTELAPVHEHPHLDKCVQRLISGDVVIVPALDRFVHSVRKAILMMDAISKREASFISLAESIHIGPGQHVDMCEALDALAALDQKVVRLRTRSGIIRARTKGTRVGRPKKMSQDDLRVAVDLIQGRKLTKKAVAEKFGVSRVTLNNHLRMAGM